jgi:RNA polymerase sigma-70 factor (ECF subfamily)
MDPTDTSQMPLSTADSQRFMRLFLEKERQVYAFILASVLNSVDADEVMQDATAIMLAKFNQFEPGTDFGAWAMQIAWYEILKFRQRRQRRATVSFSEETLEAIAGQMSAAAAAMDSRVDALAECVQQLSASDRRLVELRYQQGVSTREAADLCGRSVQAIYKAMSRIHHFLLVCIRRRMAGGGVR